MSNAPGGAPRASKLHENLQLSAGDHKPGAYKPLPGRHLDRLERGGHVDQADLLAGKLTPDGHAVPEHQRENQAATNRQWLSEERQRLAASKGDPVAYAQNSAGELSPGLENADLDRFLASRKSLNNASESDLEAKSARAQEYAAKLAADYYSGLDGRDSKSEATRQSSGLEPRPQPGTKPPREAFLPVNKADLAQRGWTQCDFILVSGDAYVDHPSFANGVISRVLEWAGFKVGVISQPNWRGLEDIKKLGAPRLGFLVGAGNLDSLLNAYTAHKLPRSDDPYSPGGKAQQRPPRATIVYCNLIRRAFGKVPIVIGGMEASQRRFAHYDYWDDRVRRSILLDSNADMLVFGMGEAQIVEIAHRLNAGEKLHEINDVRGTAFVRKDLAFLETPGFTERFGKATFTMPYEDLLPPRSNPAGKAGDEPRSNDSLALPGGADSNAPDRVQEHQDTGPHSIPAYRKNYAITFKQLYDEQDPIRGHPVVQPTGQLNVVQMPPTRLQAEAELDRWYDLPYTRMPHPDYDKQGVPAWLTTQHTIVTHRGCMGSCTFCAIWMHQGRTIVSRSIESIEKEAGAITHMPSFKGYISDVGGPTANMYGNYCSVQQTLGACKERDCLLPDPCPALRQHLDRQVEMLSRVRAVPGVKKAFIASGIRYDMLIDEKTAGEAGTRYTENLAAHHTSGHLKVAPEHTSDDVLARMRKPSFAKYEIFKQRFIEASKRVGKEQYLVAYFVSSHPGCTMDEQIALAEYFKKNNWSPEQVQDFIPTPMTPATAMFYSGFDPETMQYVYTPTQMREKRRQRALMQFNKPEFQGRVRKALREAGRTDLIGKGAQALVPPGNEDDWEDDNPARAAGIGSGPKTLKRKGYVSRNRHKPRG